jgi:hypothetical protein
VDLIGVVLIMQLLLIEACSVFSGALCMQVRAAGQVVVPSGMAVSVSIPPGLLVLRVGTVIDKEYTAGAAC